MENQGKRRTSSYDITSASGILGSSRFGDTIQKHQNGNVSGSRVQTVPNSECQDDPEQRRCTMSAHRNGENTLIKGDTSPKTFTRGRFDEKHGGELYGLCKAAHLGK